MLRVWLVILVGLMSADAFFLQYKKPLFASKLSATKFNPDDIITIQVKKPLGLGLIENEENKKSGVCVDELDDGSVKSSGKISKGMYLLKVNQNDVRYEDFDTILDILVGIPESQTISMEFIDPRKVFRGPAKLIVKNLEQKTTTTIESLKGLNLRSVLLGSNIDLYENKAKLTNCAGGGTCGTCAVEICDNEFWEARPDFEARKLKRYSDKARLACNTVIEGDCTVIIKPQKTS